VSGGQSPVIIELNNSPNIVGQKFNQANLNPEHYSTVYLKLYDSWSSMKSMRFWPNGNPKEKK
jgi:hypothetical protein